MNCQTTLVPPPEEIDIPALKEKYRQERDKRLRTDGNQQYIEVTGQYAHYTPTSSPSPASR